MLGWLIRFQVREKLAARQNLTVTASQRDQALEEIYQEATQQAQQEGVSNVSLNELAVANGLPPNLLDELGRYQAVEIAYAEKANGGKLPTATASVNAITKQFTTAECHVYKTDTVKVSPQFGRFNYTSSSVVAGADTLSDAGGAKPSKSTAGSSPSG